MILGLLLSFSVLFADLLFSHNSQGKTAVAIKINEEIKIDGDLSEQAWKKAIPISDFVQLDPYEGENPSEKTEVKILYNDKAIYLGFILYDSEPVKIVSNLFSI